MDLSSIKNKSFRKKTCRKGVRYFGKKRRKLSYNLRDTTSKKTFYSLKKYGIRKAAKIKRKKRQRRRREYVSTIDIDSLTRTYGAGNWDLFIHPLESRIDYSVSVVNQPNGNFKFFVLK